MMGINGTKGIININQPKKLQAQDANKVSRGDIFFSTDDKKMISTAFPTETTKPNYHLRQDETRRS